MSEFFNNSFDKSSNLDHVTHSFFTSKRELNTLLYGIQYNSTYSALSFVAGSVIDYVFPQFDKQKSKKVITFEVLFQIIIMSLVIHYIKKYGSKIPFVLGDKNNVDKKINATIFIILSFLFTQQNLLKKINHLSNNAIDTLHSAITNKKKELTTEKKTEIKEIVKQVLQNKLTTQQQQQQNQIPQQQKQQLNTLQTQSPLLIEPQNTIQPSNLVGGNMAFNENLITPQNTMGSQSLGGFDSNMNLNDFNNINML